VPHVIGVFWHDLSSSSSVVERQSNARFKSIIITFSTLLHIATLASRGRTNRRTFIHPLEFFSNARLVIFIVDDALATRPRGRRTTRLTEDEE
jgi:hypothetical protein